MNNEQQDREEEIFLRALEQAPGKERATWLEEACGGDSDLRLSIEQLLEAHDEPATLLRDTEAGVGSSNAGEAGGEKAGDRFGSYELVEEIGRGGMGTVWLAEQSEPVRRKVALKIIKLGMDTKEVVARFEGERQALAMMDHPGIAKVFDAGVTDNGRPFFVMELVQGQPLTRYCDERRLGTKERLGLFIDVCRAVQHAHQKGVVHRDIKPTNILVAEQDGRPAAVVIDFGVAKAVEEKLTQQTLMTGLGRVIGTLGYMSPEQAGGEQDIDTRSDIYSLGVVLYELLSGAAPFGPDRFREAAFDAALKMIREEEPPKPSTRVSALAETGDQVAASRSTEIRRLARTVRGDLDWIVMRALEKDRERRYDTANAFAGDVERFLNDDAVSASPPSAGYRMRKFVRRNRMAAAFAATVTLLLVMGITATTWLAIRATDAESDAKRDASTSREVSAILREILAEIGKSPALRRDTTALSMILDRTGERLDEDLKINPPVVAEIKSTLGSIYREIGEYGKAEEAFRKALAIWRNSRGAEQSNVATTLINLSSVLRWRGNSTEAEVVSREAIVIRKKLHGEEHPDVANALIHLAAVLEYQGRYPEAEAMCYEALAMEEKLWVPMHPNPGDSGDLLGIVLLQAQRKYGEAEVMSRKALSEAKVQFGAEHDMVAQFLNELANVLSNRGKYEEAVATHRGALTIWNNLHGAEHPDIAMSLHNLAIVLRKRGDYEEAEARSRGALAMHRKFLSEEHPDIAAILKILAEILRDQGKEEEVEQLLRDTFESRKKSHADEAAVTVAAAMRLFEHYQSVGKTEEALSEQAWLVGRPVFFEDSLAALRMAVYLVFLGLDDRHQALCRKFVEAEGIEVTATAGRAAEAVLIHPGSPADLVDKASSFARQAAALAPEDLWLQCTLGLAMVRQARYAEADAPLELATGSDSQPLRALAHAVRSISEFRQERQDDPRKHLADAERALGGWVFAAEAEVVIDGFNRLAAWLLVREARKLIVGKESYDIADDPTVGEVIVPPDSEWNWLHPTDGIDPADFNPDFHTRFSAPDFDDTGWTTGRDNPFPAGGFAYGENHFKGVDLERPGAHRHSAYFRHTFTTKKEHANLELRCQRDDGIIVYLDGEEVIRDNVEEGADAYKLHAIDTISGVAETIIHRFPIQAPLPAGEHVLAISLHNRGGGSSDLRIAGVMLVEVNPEEGEK